MDNTWIKLHRKFKEWEWFKDSVTVHLFIYLLLSANHKDGKWKGIDVKRGQFITGLKSLSENTNISYQTLRTCLKRLEKTGEINRQTNNQNSIITILKYDSYQENTQTTNRQINKRLTGNQQTTNNKQECKEGKEIKNKNAEFVSMTENEYKKLIEKHGQKNTDLFISILDNYKGSNGKKYKSDYRTILNWVIDRVKKDGKYISTSKPKLSI